MNILSLWPGPLLFPTFSEAFSVLYTSYCQVVLFYLPSPFFFVYLFSYPGLFAVFTLVLPSLHGIQKDLLFFACGSRGFSFRQTSFSPGGHMFS